MLRLDHVGIATADADRLLDVLRDLLGEADHASETLEKDGVRVAFASGGGGAQLELLEALDETSPVARFLRERKGGLHHLAFEVEDIHAMHRRVREAGYAPIDPTPRPGAGGKTIFFVHPGQTGNILIEFCTRAKPCLEPVAGAFPEGVRRIIRARGAATQTPLLHIVASSRTWWPWQEARWQAPGAPQNFLVPHTLAPRLAPGRTYIAALVDANGARNISALIDGLGLKAPHLLAQGLPVKPALADSRIQTIVWADPDPDQFEALRHIPQRMLLLTSDSEEGLRAAQALRQRFATAAIAATSNPSLRMALIEQRLAMQPTPEYP